MKLPSSHLILHLQLLQSPAAESLKIRRAECCAATKTEIRESRLTKPGFENGSSCTTGEASKFSTKITSSLRHNSIRIAIIVLESIYRQRML